MILRILLTLMFLNPLIIDAVAEEPLIVAGYLPDYRLAEWSQEIGPLTDIIFFGMSAPTDGRFDGKSISAEQIDLLTRIKAKSHCRVLFTIGGWEKSQGFVRLTKDPAQRQQFIRDALDFCVDKEFDGVDFDWEHPEGAEQIKSLADLLQETRQAFSKHNRLVTIAQAAWQDLGREVYTAVDRVHLMSYDHDFPQATFKQAQSDVQTLIDAGCPPGKIVLGIPFYGRNRAREAKSYAELERSTAFDRESDIVDGFAFNGYGTVLEKLNFARQRELGGIMIWEIGQDTRDAASLLRTIDAELKSSR